jgi:hypothetical protein
MGVCEFVYDWSFDCWLCMIMFLPVNCVWEFTISWWFGLDFGWLWWKGVFGLNELNSSNWVVLSAFETIISVSSVYTCLVSVA